MWHDKRDVSLISTNTVAIALNRGGTIVLVPCPSVVKLYNDCMGGVDMADQMSRYYSAMKKSYQIWRGLVSFVLDTCINGHFV